MGHTSSKPSSPPKEIVPCTESEVVCPKCKSKNIKDLDGGITELAYYLPFYDVDNKAHYHDDNKCTEVYECNVCHIHWRQQVLSTCICGWIQGKEGSGYQGITFQNKQKK